MGLGAVFAAPCPAQHMRRASWGPQQRRAPAAPARRQARQQQRQQQKNAARQAQQEKRQNAGGGNAPGNGANRPDSAARPNGNPNRPPSAYTPPAAQRKFSDLPPQERQRVLENYNRLSNMSPAQRQELQRRAAIWNRLTPAQKNHIRNDIMPKWKQMPLERRQAIRQRLGILQNMPEFARNERLSDPKFTEGMSDEDKATLRDLSHLHVGAPPDSPLE